jgi:hypothetical protein
MLRLPRSALVGEMFDIYKALDANAVAVEEPHWGDLPAAAGDHAGPDGKTCVPARLV